MARPFRRLAFGLSTLLGGTPLGFFIPYRHAASAQPAGYPALDALFEAASPAFEAVLAAIETHAGDLDAIREGAGPARFDQDWFPRLDAAAAYAIVRREQPRRIVEIGSGHSTRFLASAVRDGGLATEIIAIDPAPRADLSGLGVRHERRLLAEADPLLAEGFGAGDVLFVDSSHIAMPGTDVDRIVGDVLPRLAPGALLHWHDILLPDPYPQDWVWRGYNESIPVAALLGSGGYDLVFASHWVATRRSERMGTGLLGRLPFPAGARETSLWLRRR
ncbi:class I SAM-dependent methyltransferase [Enterovirga rhinocerotis]|uniref:Putative O-methyltransferase YrrM n=1 Tax=Enterovirga rhinocerotis TaxID=1339210 RepID=A0A4R7BWZ8_9HYPH|nr:class I SAM-dependent methyltransferase [Enterovirga rhinocerotis]TDR90033.1 putative O-methyltransferase YrrM [Enterovirga rhinocerotis]